MENNDTSKKLKTEDRNNESNLIAILPAFDFDKYNIGVEDVKTEAEQLLKQGNEAKESKGLFTVKTASRWIEQAKTRPIPKMLFGEFWFEGE